MKNWCNWIWNKKAVITVFCSIIDKQNSWNTELSLKMFHKVFGNSSWIFTFSFIWKKIKLYRNFMTIVTFFSFDTTLFQNKSRNTYCSIFFSLIVIIYLYCIILPQCWTLLSLQGNAKWSVNLTICKHTRHL